MRIEMMFYRGQMHVHSMYHFLKKKKKVHPNYIAIAKHGSTRYNPSTW